MKYLDQINRSADQERKTKVDLNKVKSQGKLMGILLLVFMGFLFIMMGAELDKKVIASTPVEKIVADTEEPPSQSKPKQAEPDVASMSVEEQIRHHAAEENFQWPDYLVRLAKCESKLDPKVVNTKGNSPASRDRGVFQINDYWQRQVTDEQAFDVEWSTKWTMKRINQGDQHLWSCDKLI